MEKVGSGENNEDLSILKTDVELYAHNDRNRFFSVKPFLKRVESELYPHSDRKRREQATMLWIVEEIGELAEAIHME